MNDMHTIDTTIGVMIAAQFSMVLLMLSAMIAFIRIFKGPGLSDRVVAIDFLTFVVVSFIGALATFKNDARYMDVAMVLAVVAFLATVAYARYIERVTLKMRVDQLERKYHD